MERSIRRVIARIPIYASNGLNLGATPLAENSSGLNHRVR
jgi:hypothetical protein